MSVRILLIEDDKAIREVIAELLEFEGMEVITAAEGETGVRLAVETAPHLIVCDIMMPGMNGYAVLEAIRNDPRTATIPFIFLSARADPSSMRYGMELGADSFLAKPISADELLKTINAYLSK